DRPTSRSQISSPSSSLTNWYPFKHAAFQHLAFSARILLKGFIFGHLLKLLISISDLIAGLIFDDRFGWLWSPAVGTLIFEIPHHLLAVFGEFTMKLLLRLKLSPFAAFRTCKVRKDRRTIVEGQQHVTSAKFSQNPSAASTKRQDSYRNSRQQLGLLATNIHRIQTAPCQSAESHDRDKQKHSSDRIVTDFVTFS